MGNETDPFIRDAKIEDLTAVMQLKQHYESLDDKDGIDYYQYYRELMKNGFLVVAEVAGKVVGYCACETQGSVYYIADAAVDPSSTENKIFSRIIDGISERIMRQGQARKSGSAHIVCHIKDDNHKMIEILEKKYGFKKGDNYVLFSKTYRI